MASEAEPLAVFTSLRVSTHATHSSCQQGWGKADIGSRTECRAGGTQRRGGTSVQTVKFLVPPPSHACTLSLIHTHSLIHSLIQTPGAAKSSLILCDGVLCLRWLRKGRCGKGPDDGHVGHRAQSSRRVSRPHYVKRRACASGAMGEVGIGR